MQSNLSLSPGYTNLVTVWYSTICLNFLGLCFPICKEGSNSIYLIILLGWNDIKNAPHLEHFLACDYFYQSDHVTLGYRYLSRHTLSH